MIEQFRVLVSGDREWRDEVMVRRVLDTLYRNMVQGSEATMMMIVVHGAARGADTHAGNWALDRKRTGWSVDVEEYPARWTEPDPNRPGKTRYRPWAGPERNKQMLVEGRPDLVVAFHDQILVSKGTRNMVEQAEKAGVEVWQLRHDNVEEFG